MLGASELSIPCSCVRSMLRGRAQSYEAVSVRLLRVPSCSAVPQRSREVNEKASCLLSNL